MQFNIAKPHKVYAEVIESGAIDQFKNCMAQDWVIRGALMPDAHHGYTLPIGGVVETLGIVSPSFVGVDIGCGVCAQLTSFSKEEVFALRHKILDSIRQTIPLGANHHKHPQTWRDFAKIPKTDWFTSMFWDKGGLKQLGTLGGGKMTASSPRV